jgi:hypothetical protein
MIFTKTTDMDSLISMFRKSDIDFELIKSEIVIDEVVEKWVDGEVMNGPNKGEIVPFPVFKKEKEEIYTIRVDGGYVGFYTVFSFDKNKRLTNIEAFGD